MGWPRCWCRWSGCASIEFNSNEAASRIQTSDPYVQDAIDAIWRRAELIGDGTAVADFCRAQLQAKVDLWQAEAQNTTGGRTLTFAEPRGGDGPKRGTTIGLLHSRAWRSGTSSPA